MLVRGGRAAPHWPAGAASGAVAALLTTQRLKKTSAAAVWSRPAPATAGTARNEKCRQGAGCSSPFRFVVPAELPVCALSRGRFSPGRGGKQRQVVGRGAEPAPRQHHNTSATERCSQAPREAPSSGGTARPRRESLAPSPPRAASLRVIRVR
ncbi:uncharacterized protein Tco025E_07600 [Trypanosoma conorhini]|uniref:Uncharacterized protein n=1 Tax=Trypanosoma conorhini TaxID=83891 RepID=A0A3R7RL46_9TRYP|nr:uncharacterized protein Tco025E_07600 [Trypanosoma conorhini]RNF06324.1 hypothetical protein Tco025E_07600 [Trypanosoma conorhini]